MTIFKFQSREKICTPYSTTPKIKLRPKITYYQWYVPGRVTSLLALAQFHGNRPNFFVATY